MTSTKSINYVYEDWTKETKQEWLELMYRKLTSESFKWEVDNILIGHRLFSWSNVNYKNILFFTNKVNDWTNFNLWEIFYTKDWQYTKKWVADYFGIYNLKNNEFLILDFQRKVNRNWRNFWKILENLNYFDSIKQNFLSLYKLLYEKAFTNDNLFLITDKKNLDKVKEYIYQQVEWKIKNEKDKENLKTLISEFVENKLVEISYSKIQDSIKNIISKI